MRLTAREKKLYIDKIKPKKKEADPLPPIDEPVTYKGYRGYMPSRLKNGTVKYVASIKINMKITYLGRYDSAKAANAAFKAAHIEAYGE